MPRVQAARGTPLTSAAESTPDGAPGRPAARRRLLLVLGVAVVVLAIDQVAKAIVMATLALHEPIRLLGGLLTLRLVRNPGAAFGMATGFTIVFSVIALAVVVTIIRIAGRLQSSWWALALGMLLGGAAGNLGDRLFRDPGPFRGHVVDFLELPHWPVFNLADSAIVGAGILMVILTFRGIGFDGSVDHGGHEADESDRPGDVTS
jgi:signal peptidase II